MTKNVEQKWQTSCSLTVTKYIYLNKLVGNQLVFKCMYIQENDNRINNC